MVRSSWYGRSSSDWKVPHEDDGDYYYYIYQEIKARQGICGIPATCSAKYGRARRSFSGFKRADTLSRILNAKVIQTAVGPSVPSHTPEKGFDAIVGFVAFKSPAAFSPRTSSAHESQECLCASLEVACLGSFPAQKIDTQDGANVHCFTLRDNASLAMGSLRPV